MPTDENGAPESWKLKVAGTLGAINEGVKTLKYQVSEIQQTMVKQADCQAHMGEVRLQVQEAMQEAEAAGATARTAEDTARLEIAKLRRPSTGHGYPAVPAMPAPVLSPGPSLWERVVKHSQGLSAIITLIVLAGGLLLGLGHFISRLESVMKRSDQEQKATRQLIQKVAKQNGLKSHK
jgi:hypothetical protein